VETELGGFGAETETEAAERGRRWCVGGVGVAERARQARWPDGRRWARNTAAWRVIFLFLTPFENIFHE
jgi:hypothetical protein